MQNILTLDKFPLQGLDLFKNDYITGDNVKKPVGVLIRSSKITSDNIPASVLAVSRSGSGVNNIPCEELADRGVVVMNTPGANANAVMETTIAAMIILSRRVFEAAKWVSSLRDNQEISKIAEQNKQNFRGIELSGKTLGIIGIGAIGQAVAKTAITLGMNVLGYKPFITDEFRNNLPVSLKATDNIDYVLENSDFISLHAPSTDITRGMINADSISKMKKGVFIINFARADLVDNDAIIKAVKCNHVAGHFTDFPCHEFQDIEQIIATPHLGGRTAEASDNCAIMAAQQLKDYLEIGSITNAIMYPDVSLKRDFVSRICILHKTSDSILDNVLTIIKKYVIKPKEVISVNKGVYGYTAIDIANYISNDITEEINSVSAVIRMQILHNNVQV